MSYIQDIKSLESHHLLLGGLFFAATLAPGFLIIFHFRPELVDNYDFFKLTLFSLCFTVPYVLINAFIVSAVGALGEEEPGHDYDHLAGMAMACFSSMGGLFVSLLLAYLFDSSFKLFLLYVASLTLVTYWAYWKAAREERNKKDGGKVR